MGIIPKPRTPLKSLTKLRREEEIKRLEAANDELLREMGQDSDLKALGTVQEYYKEQQEDQKLLVHTKMESLKKLLSNKIKYQRYLINILQIFLYQEDIPRKYQFTLESNDKGVLLYLDHTEFYQAFTPLGDPKYDINACKMIAVQVGNTIARLEGNFNKTEGGIILTNPEETNLLLNQERRKHGRSN